VRRAIKRVVLALVTWAQLRFQYHFRKVGKAPRLDRDLFVRGDVSLGDYCYIGRYSYLSGEITIGNFVMLASSVALVGGDHRFDLPGVPMRFTGRAERRSITVGDDVWLGHGVIVLDGTTIGEGAVVAAGSVVTRAVPPYAIVAGVPARVLRPRFSPEQQQEHARRLAEYRDGKIRNVEEVFQRAASGKPS
jgi:chloramphenicol O-acetyltransferase type B